MNTLLKLTYVFLLGLILFASCKPQKMNNQGIQGNVYWIEGNQMPQASEKKLQAFFPKLKRPLNEPYISIN